MKTLCFLIFAVLPLAVSGFCGIGEGVSASGTLTALPPAIPVQTSPQNGMTGAAVDPTLEWQPQIHTSTYHLQAASDLNFTNFVTEADQVDGNQYGLSGLDNGTTYYWRLSATNAAGISPWSQIYRFTTLNAAPMAPVNVAPANGATDVAVEAQLIWNVADGAENYHVQVSTQSDFFTLTFEQQNITSIFVQAENLTESTLYFWRVAAVNAGGTGPWSTVWMFTTAGNSAIDMAGMRPEKYDLLPASPNPFNPTVTLTYTLPEPGDIRLTIYNDMGQTVRELTTGIKPAGRHTMIWDGQNQNGIAMPTGVYFCRMHAGRHVFIQKLLLAR